MTRRQQPARRYGVSITGRQMCVVVGYEEQLRAGEGLVLHLACGALSGMQLRYAGRVRLPGRSRRFGSDLERSLRGLRCEEHPPGVASPLPGEITRVVPAVMVQVGHSGWSDAGMLRAMELLNIHALDEAAMPLTRRQARLRS